MGERCWKAATECDSGARRTWRVECGGMCSCRAEMLGGFLKVMGEGKVVRFL